MVKQSKAIFNKLTTEGFDMPQLKILQRVVAAE